jgi:hypothetical protein
MRRPSRDRPGDRRDVPVFRDRRSVLVFPGRRTAPVFPERGADR